MRKIIAAFASPNFSEATMQCIRSLDNAEQITVTGIFVPPSIYTLTNSVSEAELNKGVSEFRQYCADNHLRHRVIKDASTFGLNDLKQQSRYSDLIVLDGRQFFNMPDKEKISEYLKNILHDAECPIVVVPGNYEPPLVNLLAIDGSESSAKAMKNFAYLMPELEKHSTTILRFEPKREEDRQQELKIKEFVSVHFPNSRIVHVETDSNQYFSDWQNENKPAIVVCGAFGRSLFSVLFKHSFITDVLENGKMPVFIAHK